MTTVLSAALMSFGGAQSQGQSSWVNRFNSPNNGNELVQGMVVDSTGNVYVTGISVSSNQDILTIKYDQNGVRIWTNYFNGAANGQDAAAAIAVDGAGNVYVTGYSQVASTNFGSDGEFVTIKYAPTGSRLWVAHYQSATNLSSLATALAVDAQGNVYVTGQAQTPDWGPDYVTIKYDTNGNGVWTNRYNGPGNMTDRATAIAVDDHGNVYVTGESNGGYEAGTDFATIKYDANGNGVWTNRYNGPASATDSPVALAVDTSGNVYVAGSSWGLNTYHDYATVKYDAAGNLLWVARYNGPDDYFDFARALAVDNAGNVYVTGESRYGSFPFSSHYATVKYNPDGQQLWAARFNGDGSDQSSANALALDASGNVYVTGEANSDCVTVKYDANGNRLWLTRYHTSDWDTGLAVAVDSGGNVYMAGDATHNEDDLDFVVAKYTQTPVIDTPTITEQPQALTVPGDTNIVLTVAASSLSPLSYQWYKDGNLIAGATNATLALANLRWEDHGSYWVSVSNLAGMVVTPEARLLVQVAPRFTKHPQSHYSGTGINVTLSGEAVGTPPVGYQWQHAGTNVTDAHAVYLLLGGILPEQGGEYVLIATNAFGAATSAVAVVTMELSAPLNGWEAAAISTNLFNLRGIFHDQNGNVAVGNAGAIFSARGSNWTWQNSGTTQNLHGVTRAFGFYVAVGSVGTLLISSGLENWTAPDAQTSESLFAIAAASNNCVVVGDNGTVLTSSNGLAWTSQNAGTTADLHGLAFGQGQFVAVGKNGAILTSPDGLQWRQQTNGVVGTVLQSDLKAVAWCGGQFVIVGEQGVILTSFDATNWVQQSSSTMEDLNGVAYGEGVIVAVGDGRSGPGVILSSTDGVKWILRKSGTNKNLRAVAWSDGEFVAVANDSTIIKSASIPKPALAAFGYRPGAGIEFNLRDDIIRPFRIQASSDLNSWVDIFASTTIPGTNLVDNASVNLTFRFYRMVSP